ncbi:MAG: hypothetical protein GWP09_01510 [Nitrospiraceae bacterium]|nr:hypothetical protein [Nitrospiraceae bacterium]
MANVLDLSVVNYFNPLFVFLFVFVITYALLEKTQVFGKGKSSLNALLAFTVAIVFIFSEQASQIVVGIIPGIVLITVVFFFIILLIAFLGIDNKSLITVMGGKYASWWIIIAVLAIVGIVASTIYGPQLVSVGTGSSPVNTNSTMGSTNYTNVTSTTTGDNSFYDNLKNTLFNSKFVAMIVLLVLAAFTIKLLASPPGGK